MRLFDADALKKKAVRMYGFADSYVPNTTINQQPTIDAVEVVRCKDCKFQGDEDDCPLLSVSAYTEPEDFCSYGERRATDEN